MNKTKHAITIDAETGHSYRDSTAKDLARLVRLMDSKTSARAFERTFAHNFPFGLLDWDGQQIGVCELRDRKAEGNCYTSDYCVIVAPAKYTDPLAVALADYYRSIVGLDLSAEIVAASVVAICRAHSVEC